MITAIYVQSKQIYFLLLIINDIKITFLKKVGFDLLAVSSISRTLQVNFYEPRSNHQQLQ